MSVTSITIDSFQGWKKPGFKSHGFICIWTWTGSLRIESIFLSCDEKRFLFASKLRIKLNENLVTSYNLF